MIIRIVWQQYFDNNGPWINNDKQQFNELVTVFQILCVICWFGYLHENKKIIINTINSKKEIVQVN